MTEFIIYLLQFTFQAIDLLIEDGNTKIHCLFFECCFHNHAQPNKVTLFYFCQLLCERKVNKELDPQLNVLLPGRLNTHYIEMCPQYTLRVKWQILIKSYLWKSTWIKSNGTTLVSFYGTDKVQRETNALRDFCQD